jgi:hypothetical protein
VSSPTTQYFSPKEGQQHLRLERFPIDSIVSVREELLGDFTGDSYYEYTNEDYGLIPQHGLIKLRNRSFLEGDRSVRVVYAGGLARDPGAVPMDLRYAATRQVAFWLQKRQMPAVEVVTVARAGKVILDDKGMDLLRDVWAVLNLYKPVFA